MSNNPNQSDRDRNKTERHEGWQEKPGQQHQQQPGQNNKQQQGQKPGADKQQGQNPGKPGQQYGQQSGSAKPGQR